MAILVVMGLVNVLTIACMSEAVARSGTIRYGSAFLGRVVADYLGRAGSLILSAGLIIDLTYRQFRLLGARGSGNFVTCPHGRSRIGGSSG